MLKLESLEGVQMFIGGLIAESHHDTKVLHFLFSMSEYLKDAERWQYVKDHYVKLADSEVIEMTPEGFQRYVDEQMGKSRVIKKREAFDRILKAVRHEADTTGMVPAECAMWIMYALAREDAKEEARDRPNHTVRDELQSLLECERDDPSNWELETQMELGKELDPGFNQPIRDQEEWL